MFISPYVLLFSIPALSVRVNLDPIRPIPNINAFLITVVANLEAEFVTAAHIIADLPVCLSPIISSR